MGNNQGKRLIDKEDHYKGRKTEASLLKQDSLFKEDSFISLPSPRIKKLKTGEKKIFASQTLLAFYYMHFNDPNMP